MKALFFYLTIIGLFAMSTLTAQIPQAFKYQAAIRDTTGQVLQNKLISLRISILKGDVEGEEVYSEIHDVWTDQFGLVSLNIGQGLEVTREFSTIPWGEDTFFLKVEMDMDGAMDYHLLGTSQLMAVPYALYAESTGNEVWNKTENGISYSDGRVGIGTSAPESTLDVQGRNIELADFVFLGRMYSATDLLLGHNIKAIDYENTRGAYVANDWPLGYSGIRMYNGSIQFHTKGGHVYAGEIASNEHMRIARNGYVGIGTKEPQSTLDVNGWANVSDSLKVGNVFTVGDKLRVTEDGKVGIGTTDPGPYKFRVEIDEDGGSERAIMLLKNKSTAVGSLCNLYISAGDGSSTYLNHTSSTYIHWGGKYKSHTVLGNNGKGLVFRTGQNDQGRVAFEFRRELGDTYTYDEKVSITYDGNMGIGVIHPQRKLHINDVMRLEPRFTLPENPSEGDIYMDGSEHVLKVYDGTEWKACW